MVLLRCFTLRITCKWFCNVHDGRKITWLHILYLLFAYFLSVGPGGISQDLVLFPEDFKKNSDLSFMSCDRKK